MFKFDGAMSIFVKLIIMDLQMLVNIIKFTKRLFYQLKLDG